MERESPLRQLPDELWVQVFAFLPLPDLLLVLLVSRPSRLLRQRL